MKIGPRTKRPGKALVLLVFASRHPRPILPILQAAIVGGIQRKVRYLHPARPSNNAPISLPVSKKIQLRIPDPRTPDLQTGPLQVQFIAEQISPRRNIDALA